MVQWPPIDRDDLKVAAGNAGFDTDFPLLVRRLIAETADGLSELDMPGGSGTAAGGFDGVVTASGQTVEVPAGRSVWELSVTGGAQVKADDDYGKRLQAPDDGRTRDVTYVQAILAPWTKSRTWASARRREGRWRDVVALNLDSVHAWLDRAPATAAWLAERLGKAMPGVRPLDTWWTDTWLPSTEPVLSADLVLAGRQSQAESLVDLLASTRSIVTLAGELGRDGLRAFVAAAIETADGTVGDRLRARVLHVSDAGSLERLVRQNAPLVLVLDDAQLAADLPARHPHQLVLLAPPGGRADIEVPPVDAQQAESLFQTAGQTSERAHDLGRLARRSLPALRRVIALNQTALTPTWATAPDRLRRRLLLVGAWQADSEGDRDVIGRYLSRPYEDVQEDALALARGESPMLGRVGEGWYLIAPEDAWMLLGPHLTKDDVAAHAALALEVLGEADPYAGLSSGERLKAQLGGERRRFSGSLRRGAAQSLALMATADPATGARAAGRDQARSAVRELLDRANDDPTYVVWASLQDVLQLLAEAAPEQFLSAMRTGLNGASPLHAGMFREDLDDGFGSGNSPHSAFLWALEILAWPPQHFDEAVDVLARLAEIDPGGRLSNRPARSLAGILSVWHPETSATEEQRGLALRRLLRDKPGVGRPLLLDLLPDGNGFQTAHPAPSFRSWKQPQPALTYDDIDRRTTDIANLLLADLEDDPDRHLALIGKIAHLPPEPRTRFTARLTALAGRLDDDVARALLRDALRGLAAHHREYADTAWALPDEELTAIEAAAAALEPRDPVRNWAWLFASDWIELGDVGRRDDINAYDAEVARRRSAAVQDVLDGGGLDEVARLAEAAGAPHAVGAALAAVASDYDDKMVAWLAGADDDEGAQSRARADAAYGYVSARILNAGLGLVETLLSATDEPLARALVLRAARDPMDAWRRLDELPAPVAVQYWKHFYYFGLGSDFSDVLEAVRGLAGAGRHAAALDMTVLYSRTFDTLQAANLAAASLEALLAGGMADPELGRLASHDFERLFALLGRHRSDLGEQRVVNLEWQLFPALGFQADAPSLHGALTEQPSFFAELVRYLYKRDSDGDAETEDGLPPSPEQRREFASRAYSVLRSWRRCPAAGTDNRPDAAGLRAWTDQARAALAKDDRIGPGDSEIGQILAWAAPDDDGMSPPRAVRDLLEDIGSDRLDRGLEVGLYNRRGVTSRGVYDGGIQEKDLAAGYRQGASEAMAWPRTARLLRRLADSYEHDARTLEEGAEALRRGIDT